MVSFPGAASDANKLSQCQSNGSTSWLDGQSNRARYTARTACRSEPANYRVSPNALRPKSIACWHHNMSCATKYVCSQRHTCPCTCCTQLPFASTFRLCRGPTKHTCRIRNLYLSFGSATVSERGRCALPEIRNNNSQTMTRALQAAHGALVSFRRPPKAKWDPG